MQANKKFIQLNILIIVFAFFFSTAFYPAFVLADETSTTTESQTISQNAENTTTTDKSNRSEKTSSENRNNNTTSSSSSSSTNERDNSAGNNSKINNNKDWTLDYKTEFENYYVFDNLNRSKLYKKNELVEREDPLALNILISLLAIETLDINSSITISNETATKSANENISNVILNAGSKYEVQFLIYATLFYDSKAALEALTLSLSESVESFQTLVNSRLQNLNMDSSKLIVNTDKNTVKLSTNSQDMGFLLAAAYTNTLFKKIFTSNSEIYISPLAEQNRPLYLRNRMDFVWTWTRNEITGALSASDENSTSFAYIFPGDNYSIYMLQNAEYNGDNTDKSRVFNNSIIEASSLRNEILSNYIRTVLIQRGDYFDTIALKNGMQVELIYLNTVYYLKPTFISEIVPQISFKLQDTINLPITAGESLGTINMVFPNGDSFSADVGSNNNIYSQNNIIENLLSTISENENIARLIYALFIVLLIVILIEIALFLFRKILFNNRNKLKK